MRKNVQFHFHKSFIINNNLCKNNFISRKICERKVGDFITNVILRILSFCLSS